MKSRKYIWLTGTALITILLGACNLGSTPAPAVDPGAIQTQAFNLVNTQAANMFTQTALAQPPTSTPTNTPPPSPTLGGIPTFDPLGGSNTPFSFNTQPPGLTPLASIIPTVGIASTVTTKNGCNDGQYVGETGYIDGTPIEAGKEVKKAWTINNTGQCDWDEGYAFVFLKELSSPEIAGYDIVLSKNRPDEFTKAGYGQTYVIKFNAPKTAGTFTGYWKLRDDTVNYFGPLVWVKVVVP